MQPGFVTAYEIALIQRGVEESMLNTRARRRAVSRPRLALSGLVVIAIGRSRGAA